MGKRIFITEAQYKKLVNEMVDEYLNPFNDQANHEEGFKVMELIGKTVVFKTNQGSTGFVVDDVQAQRDGWLLRANRQDGRSIKFRDVEGLLNGKIPAPSAILYNQGNEVSKGWVIIST